MFPDLSKAADALIEARDLMRELIDEIKGARHDMAQMKVEFAATLASINVNTSKD